MLHKLTDSETLYTKAKCLSDDVSSKSSSLSVLKESLQGICASVDLDSECERAAVEAVLQKIIQSIELQYIIMQKRHANIQKKASKYTSWWIIFTNSIHVIYDSVQFVVMLLKHMIWCSRVSLTDSSKQRARLQQAITEDRKKLDHFLLKYNELIEVYGGSLQLEPANLDDVVQGIFPWSELSGMCTYQSFCPHFYSKST